MMLIATDAASGLQVLNPYNPCVYINTKMTTFSNDGYYHAILFHPPLSPSGELDFKFTGKWLPWI